MECDDVHCIENTVIIFLFIHLQMQRIRMMQLGKKKCSSLWTSSCWDEGTMFLYIRAVMLILISLAGNSLNFHFSMTSRRRDASGKAHSESDASSNSSNQPRQLEGCCVGWRATRKIAEGHQPDWGNCEGSRAVRLRCASRLRLGAK